jgi:hypothetical protein
MCPGMIPILHPRGSMIPGQLGPIIHSHISNDQLLPFTHTSFEREKARKEESLSPIILDLDWLFSAFMILISSN